MLKNHSLLVGLCISIHVFSQTPTDTVPLSLHDAETKLIQNNLLLVAANYNIEASKALIIQAKLWDNPVLNTDQNIYDGKFFRHTTINGQPYGQVFIQLLQVFKTAGKRSKLAELSSTSSKLAELQFTDVLRNLKYALRTNFYSALQLTQTHQLYQRENSEIEKLLGGMKAQYAAGNISQKELLRVQALQLSLKQSIADNEKQYTDVNSQLKLLLQEDKNVWYVPQAANDTIAAPAIPTIDSLVSKAQKNNPEYLSEQNQLLFQQQNLSYQKALKVPDITAGVEYDHASSYTPNYWGLAISLPLPLLNRNQGNIKAAQQYVKQEETLLQVKDKKLLNDIQNALSKLQLSIRVLQSADVQFYPQYEQLFYNATQSYQQRQLGLLEYIDLFEAYRDTQLQYQQQKLNYRKAIEDLHFIIGTDIIK